MKNKIILCFLIIPTIIFGQKDTVQLFDPSQIKSDIDTLIYKLIEVHPTFKNYYADNKIQNKVDSIKNSVYQPITALDLFRMMQPIVTIDGHTSLIYTGEIYPKLDNPFFPFKIVLYNNTIYIKENLSDNKSILMGSIIETINGIPAETIINNLIRYIPGEKESYKIKKLENEFYIYYELVYGSFSNFNIALNKSVYKLKGVKWSEFQES